MNTCSGVVLLLFLLTFVCMFLMEQTLPPSSQQHHPLFHQRSLHEEATSDSVAPSGLMPEDNNGGARSACAVRPMEEDEDPWWGSWLDNTQTRDQRRAMLAACPSHRIVHANRSVPFEQFIDDVAAALNHAVIGERPIWHLIAHFDAMWQTHGALRSGFWAEFGVWKGNSLIRTAQHLLQPPTTPTGAARPYPFSAPQSVVNDSAASKKIFDGVVAGFDSFSGLPSFWRTGFHAGNFASKSTDLYRYVRRKVPAEVEIYKGWFQTTIGSFLDNHPRMPATFIHHDGDLFVSTAITLSLLARHIVPGTVMCFDELYGYPTYEQHEILAMFLWMVEYDVQMCALSTQSKIDPKKVAGVLADEQSACFQVLTLRGDRHEQRRRA